MIESLYYLVKSRSGFGPKSNKWKHWKATLDLKTCYECRTIHGKIYSINETVSPMPPLHWCCRCEITPMNAYNAEECTKQGITRYKWCALLDKNLRTIARILHYR